MTMVLLALPELARAGDADDDGAPPAKPSWLARLFQPKSPAPVKTKPSKTKDLIAPKVSALNAAASAQAREKADWIRRIAVCDKLREIAIVANDEELRRKADQLDQRAWDVYVKHTANLPSGMASLQDERILGRRLGTSGGTGQGLLPAAPRGQGSQAALREDRP